MRNSWSRLCREGHVERSSRDGSFREGEPAAFVLHPFGGFGHRCFVESATDDVEITDRHRGVYGGAFQAYLGDRIRQVYNNSLRANVRSRFFVLGAEQFAQLMRDWFPMALHLLEGCSWNPEHATGTRTARAPLALAPSRPVSPTS